MAASAGSRRALRPCLVTAPPIRPWPSASEACCASWPNEQADVTLLESLEAIRLRQADVEDNHFVVSLSRK